MRKENQIKESLGYEIFKVVNTVLMLIICFVTLYPFLYLVAQSFSSEQAIMSGKVGLIPVDFNLETYISVLKKGDFLRSYKNTLI